jgi:hypothetical protein
MTTNLQGGEITKELRESGQRTVPGSITLLLPRSVALKYLQLETIR